MLSLGGEVTIWATEFVSEDWQSQILVPLHKESTRTGCDNYHGIALLSIPVVAEAVLPNFSLCEC